MGTPSDLLRLGFWGLPPAMIAVLLVLVRAASVRAGLEPAAVARRLGLVALGAGGFWLLGVGLARAGALRFGTLPPRPFLFFLIGFALTVALSRSRVGRDLALRLPLSFLVGVQAFRILVELLLHQGAADGVTPPQMTWSGYNFDVITGLLALPLAVALQRGGLGPRAAWAFNWLGIALLANVLVIAILSMPTPLRAFHNEPANVWIAEAPFIGLPGVLVPFALLGHLLLWRRMREHAAARSEAEVVSASG